MGYGSHRLVLVTHLAIIFKIFPFTLILKFGAINIYESTACESRHGEEEKQIWSLIKCLLWVGGDSVRCLCIICHVQVATWEVQDFRILIKTLDSRRSAFFTLSHVIADVAELFQDQGLAMAFNYEHGMANVDPGIH